MFLHLEITIGLHNEFGTHTFYTLVCAVEIKIRFPRWRMGGTLD